MCKQIYEGEKAKAFLSLFENDKTLWQIAKLVYVDGLTHSKVATIVGYSERQIGRLCKKIKQIADKESAERKYSVEKITAILKAYTDKHGIMALVVILQEYAEELVRNGVVLLDKESEVDAE